MTERQQLESACSADFILVRKSEVPVYLHSGAFFQSLSDEDDEQISVPSNVLKMDTKIENVADLEHLLSSLRFWGVSDVSEEVIRFCLFTDDGRHRNVLEVFKKQFPYVDVLCQMLRVSREESLNIAIRSGILPIVRELIESGEVLAGRCSLAADHGHVHILQYLHEKGGKLTVEVLTAALQSGSLSCVKYLHSQGVKWPDRTLVNALQNNHTDCFLYAHQHGCIWDRKLPTMTFIWNRNVLSSGLSHNDTYAQRLRFAIQHGYPLCADEATTAARRNAFQCLQVLHEANCPWDASTCAAAAMAGHLRCLQYAHEHGCEWDADTCTRAATSDHIDCLKYAHEHGGSWDADTSTHAAALGHLQCLKYAHEHGCAWDARTTLEAARYGYLNCLQYAHENGCEWNYETTCAAAKNGHLNCLKYAHEHGCAMQQVLDAARAGRQQACIDYVMNHVPQL